jgi:outer membrane protein TolC
MSKVDLDTVMARRAEVANELAAIERMRAEIEAEDQELSVAERVLKRLAGIPAGADESVMR